MQIKRWVFCSFLILQLCLLRFTLYYVKSLLCSKLPSYYKMFFFIIMLIVVLITVFSNALFYTVSLLAISIIVLIWVVCSNLMSTLILLLIIIVYVGAIMIFIGYICAVCPNFIITPNYNYLYLYAFCFLIYFLTFNNSYVTSSSKLGSLLDYFFRDWGVLTFILVALMLFSTLLIVTSQYSSPQGPFRSI